MPPCLAGSALEVLRVSAEVILVSFYDGCQGQEACYNSSLSQVIFNINFVEKENRFLKQINRVSVISKYCFSSKIHYNKIQFFVVFQLLALF